MATTGTPRRGSGTSGIGGRRRIRADVVTAPGAVWVHARQAWRTSCAWAAGQKVDPAKTSAYGSRPISIAVTTPKLPPPPRRAQNRSGSCS